MMTSATLLLLVPLLIVASFGTSCEAFLFVRFRCFARLILLRYDVTAYDRYDQFYRDDSVYALAETGAFVGPADIVEYQQAGGKISSYYIEDPVIENLEFQFESYDRRSNLCEFFATAISTLTSDPSVTGVNIRYRSGTLTKIFLNLREGYISDQRAYLSYGFWAEAVPLLQNSTETRAFVCSVMENECADILGPIQDCAGKLLALPYATLDNGVLRYQKNSVSCRVLHANLAKRDPVAHCPHTSFEGMEDPKGLIKCQDDIDNGDLTVEDLFTTAEIDAFEQWQLDNGLGESGTIIEYLD